MCLYYEYKVTFLKIDFVTNLKAIITPSTDSIFHSSFFFFYCYFTLLNSIKVTSYYLTIFRNLTSIDFPSNYLSILSTQINNNLV